MENLRDAIAEESSLDHGTQPGAKEDINEEGWLPT